MTATLSLSLVETNERRQMWLVRLDGQAIGLLVKGRNTRTDTLPWQAFRLDGGESRPNTLLGSYYGRHGKGKALRAIEASYQG